MEAQDSSARAASPSRRRMLKTGVAATGAAYVAPQILNTAVAGAQTTTCYAFKIENGNDGLNPGPPVNDPSCSNDPVFNTELGAAAGPTPNLTKADGLALITVTSGGVGGQDATITLNSTATNCTIEFAGFKAGPSCYTGSGASVTVAGDKKSVTMDTPGNQAISHITLVICCTGSP